MATITIGRWGETNGVEYTYRNLLPFFRRDGIEVELLSYGPADSVERDGSITYRIHRPRLPVRVDDDLFADAWLLKSELARRILANRYGIVHSGTPDPLGIMAAIASRKSDCPLVGIFHTALDRFAEERAAKAWGARVGGMAGRVAGLGLKLYYNRADLVLAPTPGVRDDLSGRFASRVEVLSRGIDTEKFSPHHRTRRSPAVQALYVGRVAAEKNLDMLVRVFAARPEIELKVVGDGSWLPEMMRLLPAAEFTGKLTGEVLWSAFADADLFVFPSLSDSFGNVVLQAMSSGLPVVLADRQGPGELIRDRVTGFLATDDDSFGAAVDRLAAEPELRRRMGEAGRELVSARSWEEVYRNLLSHYYLARNIYRNSGRGATKQLAQGPQHSLLDSERRRSRSVRARLLPLHQPAC